MSPGVPERLAHLLSLFDEAIQADHRSKATSILREASNLDPQNDEVKARWIQLEDGKNDVLKLLRSSLADPDDDVAARAAVEALGQRRLSATDAGHAFDLLSPATESANFPRRDELMAILLNRQNEAKSLLNRKLLSNATTVYEQLFPIGERAFNAVVTSALDILDGNTDGTRKTAAAACHRELFQFCTKKLLDSSDQANRQAVIAFARLLSVQPALIAGLINADVVNALLSALDIRKDTTLRASSLLATSKMLEVAKERGEQLFVDFVTFNMQQGKVLPAFSAAAALFPIIPAVTSKLFLTEGFVESVVSSRRVTESDDSSSKNDTDFVEQAILELLSAACVDKACRDSIEKHCVGWLNSVAKTDNQAHSTSANLILAKLGKGSTDETVTRLAKIALNDSTNVHQAIEGLAYASLQSNVKEQLSKDTALLETILAALKSGPESAFGALTIFANLTAYRPQQSEEQKRLAELKAYANASPAQSSPDPLDDDRHVTGRCKMLLELGLVSALVASPKLYASPTIAALEVRILLSLTKEQKHRSKMAQQGAVRLLLQINERSSRKDWDKAGDDGKIQHHAAHALARLLISVNPAHVFTSAIPVTSAVSALATLLAPNAEAEERDLLPIFEALLALTNLASMDDPTARDQLIRTSFDNIEDLLFSPNTMIQRATVELLCNLMASPFCVAKFADGSKDSKRRLLILLALTDVEDLATRRAAGGALAMLTEWDAAVSAVLDAKDTNPNQRQEEQPKGVKAVMRMCQDESVEIKHRGLVCLQNLLSAPGKIGAKAAKMVKEVNGATVVRDGLKGLKNPTVLAVGVDVVKKLV